MGKKDKGAKTPSSGKKKSASGVHARFTSSAEARRESYGHAHGHSRPSPPVRMSLVESLKHLSLNQSFYRAAVLGDDGVEKHVESSRPVPVKRPRPANQTSQNAVPFRYANSDEDSAEQSNQSDDPDAYRPHLGKLNTNPYFIGEDGSETDAHNEELVLAMMSPSERAQHALRLKAAEEAPTKDPANEQKEEPNNTASVPAVEPQSQSTISNSTSADQNLAVLHRAYHEAAQRLMQARQALSNSSSSSTAPASNANELQQRVRDLESEVDMWEQSLVAAAIRRSASVVSPTRMSSIQTPQPAQPVVPTVHSQPTQSPHPSTPAQISISTAAAVPVPATVKSPKASLQAHQHQREAEYTSWMERLSHGLSKRDRIAFEAWLADVECEDAAFAGYLRDLSKHSSGTQYDIEYSTKNNKHDKSRRSTRGSGAQKALQSQQLEEVEMYNGEDMPDDHLVESRIASKKSAKVSKNSTQAQSKADESLFFFDYKGDKTDEPAVLNADSTALPAPSAAVVTPAETVSETVVQESSGMPTEPMQLDNADTDSSDSEYDSDDSEPSDVDPEEYFAEFAQQNDEHDEDEESLEDGDSDDSEFDSDADADQDMLNFLLSEVPQRADDSDIDDDDEMDPRSLAHNANAVPTEKIIVDASSKKKAKPSKNEAKFDDQMSRAWAQIHALEQRIQRRTLKHNKHDDDDDDDSDDSNDGIMNMRSNTRGLGGRKISKGERLSAKKARKLERRALRAEGVPESEIRRRTQTPGKNKRQQQFALNPSSNIRSRLPSKQQQEVLQDRYGVSAEMAQAASYVATHPIHENNIGHKMLRALGWRGGGLGTNGGGIVEPIAVSLKKGRAGLGNE